MKRELRVFVVLVCFVILSAPAFSQEVYKFDLMWGSPGTGEGQFDYPSGLAVDPLGNVYVADTGNRRIQKFDSTGNFITEWATYYPKGVAVGSLGNVYVSDTYQIQKFDTNGTYLTEWNIVLDSFNVLRGVAVDLSENAYVAVGYECWLSPCPTLSEKGFRIEKFDLDGKFKTKWGSTGSEEGQFEGPNGVAVDLSGNVYVADTNGIQKFDSNGNFITKWYIPAPFSNLEGIGTDFSSNVYVTTNYCCPLATCPIFETPRIWKFDPNGNLIAKWGDVGISNCQYNSSGLAVNSLGSVYVADTYNNRIQKFSLTLSSIILRSPSINEHFNACSLNSPPAFSWSVSEAFNDYEVQFSPDRNFGSISFEFGVQSPAIQITIPPDTWEEIMMNPGALGGTVYWRVIGTKADGTTETSAVRSFSVSVVADPAGNPTISPTRKRSRPTLTWEKNCNTKFKVSFGSDSSFTKKTYTFEIENSSGNEGTFSKTLTPLEWLRIKMLVRNKTGSSIYWYVESWDALGRYSKTEVMTFVLTD